MFVWYEKEYITALTFKQHSNSKNNNNNNKNLQKQHHPLAKKSKIEKH